MLVSLLAHFFSGMLVLDCILLGEVVLDFQAKLIDDLEFSLILGPLKRQALNEFGSQINTIFIVGASLSL